MTSTHSMQDAIGKHEKAIISIRTLFEQPQYAIHVRGLKNRTLRRRFALEEDGGWSSFRLGIICASQCTMSDKQALENISRTPQRIDHTTRSGLSTGSCCAMVDAQFTWRRIAEDISSPRVVSRKPQLYRTIRRYSFRVWKNSISLVYLHGRCFMGNLRRCAWRQSAVFSIWWSWRSGFRLLCRIWTHYTVLQQDVQIWAIGDVDCQSASLHHCCQHVQISSLLISSTTQQATDFTLSVKV